MDSSRRNASSAVILLAGTWLFVTVFLWPHTSPQGLSTLAVGVLTIAFALLIANAPPARFIIAALAVWLFVSAFLLPHGTGTEWNNAIVAVLVFVASLSSSIYRRAQVAGPEHDALGRDGPDLPVVP